MGTITNPAGVGREIILHAWVPKKAAAGIEENRAVHLLLPTVTGLLEGVVLRIMVATLKGPTLPLLLLHTAIGRPEDLVLRTRHRNLY